MALPRPKLGKGGTLFTRKSGLGLCDGWRVGVKDRVLTQLCNCVRYCLSMESVERFLIVARIERAVGEEAVDFVGVFGSQRLFHSPWAGVLPDNLMGSVGNTMAAEENLRTKELNVVLNHSDLCLVVEMRDICVGVATRSDSERAVLDPL